MTNSQALARAQHELNFYRQVKKDGITMTDNLDFWEKIGVVTNEINLCRCID